MVKYNDMLIGRGDFKEFISGGHKASFKIYPISISPSGLAMSPPLFFNQEINYI